MTKKFDIDFLVLISLFHNMIRCTPNTVVMYVKRWSSNCLLFVKTHHYSNKQLIVDGKVDHNIIVIKKRNRLQSVGIKGNVNLDIAPKEHEIWSQYVL